MGIGNDMIEMEQRMTDYIQWFMADPSTEFLSHGLYRGLINGIKMEYTELSESTQNSIGVGYYSFVCTIIDRGITFDEIKEWYKNKERLKELFIRLYELEKL